MAILENVEVAYRGEGPGTPPLPVTPTVGILAIAARQMRTCIASTDGAPAMVNAVPEAIPIFDLNPIVSVCTMRRDVVDADDFRQESHTTFGVFGGRWNDTVEMLMEQIESRREGLEDEFGQGLNLSALEAIDLSSYPLIVRRFRSNYFRMFETFEGFSNPVSELCVAGTWNGPVVEELFAAIQQPETEPIHVLERWYWHAIVSVAGPAYQAYLQGS